MVLEPVVVSDPVAAARVEASVAEARALGEAAGQGAAVDGSLLEVEFQMSLLVLAFVRMGVGGVEGGPGERIVRDFELTPTDGDRPQGELTGIGAVLRAEKRP